MAGPDLSPEARAFIESYIRDDSPTDFSRIVQIRNEVQEMSAPSAERAIVRHALDREEIVINGVECERVRSRNSGLSQGTLVYLFGGGFSVGCPYSDLAIIGALAQWCQVEVIAPKYRLAPEHPAPAAADDCLAVWRQVSSKSTESLLLAGESAGGNLAVLLAQRALSEGMRIPDAMGLMSPAVDLRTDPGLREPTTNADPTLSPNRVLEVISTYGSNRDPADPSISPLFGLLEGLPPTFITTGTRDMLLSMCLRLDRQMRRAGVEVECRVWDGLWHVFEYYDGFPEAEESLREIAAFLNDKKVTG
ncbi:MAG: alpha/beta hydrolase fold domain-containing protein [Gammaproteobacteria bacterium]|nr:alpha/beta hydrolase fold domain-containing protein [Gammaproteobacteria bacterium]MDX2459995.1 alpha/beta hydrolase fold domain-containing protein [Gammaproteobacteria bacterium]